MEIAEEASILAISSSLKGALGKKCANRATKIRIEAKTAVIFANQLENVRGESVSAWAFARQFNNDIGISSAHLRAMSA